MTEIPIPEPITQPDNPHFVSGLVAIVGRPNVGKSTLLNTIIGSKIAITTPIAQTTRHIVRGIVTTEDAQIVFVDTPGIHKPKSLLGKRLNVTATDSIEGVDVLIFMVDGKHGIGKGDQWVIDNVVKAHKGPVIAVINKTDAFATPEQLPAIAQLAAMHDFDEIIPVSARKNDNVTALLTALSQYLPEGPMLYPDDEITDQPIRARIGEIIREKAMSGMRDELPHSIAVMIEQMGPGTRPDVTLIYGTILVERNSQKGIVIGKRGTNLSAIGTNARPEIEELVGSKVYLDLHVKLFAEWQQSPKKLTELGY